MSKSKNTPTPEDLIDEFIDGDSQFNDNYQTREQKARDCEITKLLRQYVTSYSEKVKTQKTYRTVLLILCSSIIGLFSIAFLILLLYFGFNSSSVDVSGVVSLISICITFLVSILGLAQIITKYCFPENDEEYISKIVETIQANDLQNKLANMQNTTNSETKEKSKPEEKVKTDANPEAKTETNVETAAKSAGGEDIPRD